MKNFFTILKLTANVCIFVALPLVVVTLITSKTDALFGLRSFVVLSGSMAPKIPVGSIIFSKVSSQYQEGDIVTFKNKQGIVVTHRIVEGVDEAGNLSYRTKGDANGLADTEIIPDSAIVGEQVLIIPYLGRLTTFLRTLPGLLGVIIIPSILYIGYEMWSIKKDMEVEVENKYKQKIGIA